jgi:hypothetical protein
MRTTLTLFLLFASTFIARADPPEEDILRPRIPTAGTFFIGFDVGTNATWFDGNPIYRAFFDSEEESRLFRSALGFEPFGSLYLGLRFSPELTVRVRGDYDLRTAERKGTTVDSCPLIDAATGEQIGSVPVGVEKQFNLSVTYITFSLLGEYHLGQAYIFLGPSFALPVNRSFTETDRIVEESSFCTYFAGTPDSTRQIRADVDGTDNLSSVISLKLGVGYMIPMSSKLSLVPQIGLDLPFTTALVDDEPFTFHPAGGGARGITTRLNHHMYFRALQASIGLRYNF